jgi:hypothetical protein
LANRVVGMRELVYKFGFAWLSGLIFKPFFGQVQQPWSQFLPNFIL